MFSFVGDGVHCRGERPAIRRLFKAFVMACLPVLAFAQVKDRLPGYGNWSRYDAIERFYQLHDYRFVWISNPNACNELLDILQRSDSLGLDQLDYQYSFVQSYQQDRYLKTADDSANADIRLTDAAIHFFTELKFGNSRPSFGYAGLKYDPVAGNSIVADLAAHLRTGTLDRLVSDLQPGSKEYAAIIKRLNWFRRVSASDAFREVKLTSRSADAGNKALWIRLYQLGVTDSILTTNDRKVLTASIKKAQSMFDLLNDGVVRSTALKAWNVPLRQRMKELRIALNILRWTNPIRQTSSVLLLNIPSAYLMVYDRGAVILDSKVIVGKTSTPTPTLSSTITTVILYPFWNVPQKIATKELLPSIRRDIGFLERGNYQVLNREGKVLNPYKINWSGLSSSYFPYQIRQSTGCDNALGLVKFEFYNPFTVYLHDTPNKALFSFNKRYFSHGCMRVEKPVELARILLGRNRAAIDTLTAKGCLNQQAPKPVPVERVLPVMILYSTVWYNRDGEIRFYDDVYDKLN